MRYYLIAGEASGDLHGSLLIRSLKERDPKAEFRFIGGDLMIKESRMSPFRPISKFSFMGFLEVAKNLPAIFRNLREVCSDVIAYKPDALILIDFPGFNLRIAAKVHPKGIPIYFFISPKVWAWNSKRVLKIKRDINHMLVIFPFEVDFYKKWGMDVDYVGNPLMDTIHPFQVKEEKEPGPKLGSQEKPLIALLPGSRKQEIEKILPVMLEMVPVFPEYEFILAGAPGFKREYYEPYIEQYGVKLVFGQTYLLLSQSSLALVTSGTATLETALLHIPQVVLYKTSGLSYEIGKWVIRVPYISLVNLIMESPVVKELIQKDCNPSRLREEILKILPGQLAREKMLDQYRVLQDRVGGPGASIKAAELIFTYMHQDGK